MRITIELAGGLELLFDRSKRFDVDVPPAGAEGSAAPAGAAAGSLDLRGLVLWLARERLRERPELFLAGAALRPGIMVLINEADAELDGGHDAPLADGDVVTLISTLHGG
jgi:ubiquitin related modifier 1